MYLTDEFPLTEEHLAVTRLVKNVGVALWSVVAEGSKRRLG